MAATTTTRRVETGTQPRTAAKPRDPGPPARASAWNAAAPPVVKLGTVVELLGRPYYRTEDGKLVELPPDMSYQEAVKLVSEGQAAMKRIGKGPQPKPVEDVKKLDKREPPAKPKAEPKTDDEIF